MPRREPQEHAIKGDATRALNRAERNVNTSVALEAKALRGGNGKTSGEKQAFGVFYY
jgi:hypothetical protein